MNKYNFSKIERHWQGAWQKEKICTAKDGGTRPKKYILIEFPYPSGEGLHMGHLRPYVAGDVYSRYLRMKGYEVMYPIGWDAFGLPAENFAIKKGIHPKISTAQNIKNAKRQIRNWGISFDWSREINTTDPKYYKWTQWMFLQFLKAGLAYEATGVINWCWSCQTGLANEEVIDERCERCGAKVGKKKMRQWYLKITAYADKLLEGLKKLDWPERVKVQQKNWIGKSEGALIDFEVKGTDIKIEIFTTRPDTIFGATYMVLAPESPLITALELKIKNIKDVLKYVRRARRKKDQDRVAGDRAKTGIELKGIKAINPATKKEIPVWVADYVLGDVGTGAIMAVPAHDERDFEFATRHNLPIREVVAPRIDADLNADQRGSERFYIGYVKRIWSNDFDRFVKNLMGISASFREKSDSEVVFKIRNSDVEKFIKFAKENVKKGSWHDIVGEEYITIFGDGRVIPVKKFGNNKKLWEEQKKLEKSVRRSTGIWNHLFNSKYKDLICYTGEGVLINSEKFSGMDSEKAKWEITRFVGGKIKSQYKLRDWVFSRQRYWGEPIPVIHCSECGIVPVPEEDLPVLLPKVEQYQPTGTGESPLAAISSWVNVKCPVCQGHAKRETNTMPQWAGSSWYYLRYADPKNTRRFAGNRLLKHWLPVDVYFGGMEHTILHLLYSRFWHIFLHDQRYVPTGEPYARRVPHGIVLGSDGEKMSKSRGNVVSPDSIVDEFGADVLRMYELFLGPHEATVSWDNRGILGIERFLNRVWKLYRDAKPRIHPPARVRSSEVGRGANDANRKSGLDRLVHKTIKKVTEDIENFRYNTAVSSLMVLLNEFEKQPSSLFPLHFSLFVKLLAPFAPHLTEEIWRNVLDNKSSIHAQPWPKYDVALIKEDTFTLVVQVDGKARDSLEAPIGVSEPEARDLALKSDKIRKFLAGAKPKKIIYVPRRLVNIVI